MAVAGGTTTAYVLQVHDYRLKVVRDTKALSSECAGIPEAVAKLQAGDTVIVAGGDVAKLRMVLASYGVG